MCLLALNAGQLDGGQRRAPQLSRSGGRLDPENAESQPQDAQNSVYGLHSTIATARLQQVGRDETVFVPLIRLQVLDERTGCWVGTTRLQQRRERRSSSVFRVVRAACK